MIKLYLNSIRCCIGLRKMAPARASLHLPGTGERERRGNTEPLEGLFSRPDTVAMKMYPQIISPAVNV